MGVLMGVLIFAVGGIFGFTIAAVTETRVERKLDKKFWAMQNELKGIFKN